MSTRISHISYYLPSGILSNEQLEKDFIDWSAQKIEEKTGIRERHIASKDETALDLAINAAENLFLNYDKSQIDFVFFCTQSPDHFLPTTACILQERIGLRTNIGALDFNLGCSGFIYGLSLADSVIKSGLANSVLLVTAETYSKHLHVGDKGNRIIFGDGGAVTIVEKSDNQKIFNFVLGTDGRGAKNLIVPNGAMRSPFNTNAELFTDEGGSSRTDNCLFMNGPEIFNFTIEKIPGLVNETLAKNNLTLDTIDYIIFHQANKYMLSYLRKKIKIPEEKFYLNLVHTGNTVSATIPIAIKDCIDAGTIKSGDKVLLVGFGVGYSWGAVVIEM